MKKLMTYFLLVCILVSIVAIAGCNSNKKDGNETDEPTADVTTAVPEEPTGESTTAPEVPTGENQTTEESTTRDPYSPKAPM